ncbi:MAG: DUF1579 domain-containing protein [Planctomyces sp.]|nr:DUF1579 domain-containing protein [Planctomyces sp.]
MVTISCRTSRLTFTLPFVATLLLTLVASAGVNDQEVQKPGKEHEKLKQMVGSWDAVVSTPGSPDSKGSATYRMTCRGMWLQSNFETDMGGEKFVGRGMDSWDAAQSKYVSVWFDSMSGTPLTFYGNYDDAGKVLTMTSESKGPDGTVMKWKSVSTEEDADHHAFKLTMILPDATEAEVIAIRYTRRPEGEKSPARNREE